MTEPLIRTNPQPTALDLFGFGDQSLSQDVIRYASGVLAPSIWEGYRLARRAMCVAASEMNPAAIQRACEYLQAGGSLLVDSGAFIYRDRPDRMPWPRVLSVYSQIAAAAETGATFILPDSVGSQAESLEAISTWGSAVQAAVGQHETLLPIQAGEQPAADYVAAALQLLDQPIGGLAMPSHAAAFPPEQLYELSSVQDVPMRVHFLGISRNSKGLQSRIIRLKEFWPDVVVSCDACEHRASVGAGRPITVARTNALSALWDTAMDEWDETEEPDEPISAELRALFPDADEEDLGALMCSDWGRSLALKQYHARSMKILGPKATTASIFGYATGNFVG